MDLLTYKVLHIFGISLALFSLGGLTLTVLEGAAASARARKLVGITHGLAMLVILVSGFGMLAKLGIGFPQWVWLKILIWIFIGGVLALIRRFPERATLWWWLLPLVVAFGGYLAIYKPF